MFFCCVRRWPLLVASDLAKCFVTREVVRPGQDSKWARSMARKTVDGTGLYRAACKNIARSALVALSWMAPFARWIVGFGAIGRVHSPLLGSRSPTIMICPCLYILTSYLVNRATQSSSHSWPMERSEPDLRPSKMWPSFALLDNSFASGTVARLVVSMFWPLATWTEGPSVVGSILMQWGSAAASR